MKIASLLSFILAVANAAAQSIIPTNVTRYAASQGQGTAFLNLTVDDSQIAASGNAAGGGFPAYSSSGSVNYSVTFSLETACSYSIVADTAWYYDGFGGCGVSEQLTGDTGTVFTAFVGAPWGSTYQSSQTGVLDAGVYTLGGGCGAYGEHGANSSFDIALTVEPVPEPQSRALTIFAAFFLVGVVATRLHYER